MIALASNLAHSFQIANFRLVFATELITIHRRNGSSKEVPCFSPVQGTLHILPQTGIVDVVK